jgi:hypothetical protein
MTAFFEFSALAKSATNANHPFPHAWANLSFQDAFPVPQKLAGFAELLLALRLLTDILPRIEGKCISLLE